MTTLSEKLTEAVIQSPRMRKESLKFPVLFKKYRLKAELATLSSFGMALAEKGLIYEDSIFSHWQKGTRIPQNRIVLIKLIEIFIEKKAITTLPQANEFLSSARQGYLSEEELENIPIKLHNPIFQVPNEIINFNGREEIIKNLTEKENVFGKVILIHGTAGIGKTVLAIKLGHALKSKFSDGVLWYKVEEDNIMDILLSIARVCGEDISSFKDIKVRTTIVRSLLASKNLLIFLDSGELYENIHLLIPNSSFCTTVITSQKKSIKLTIDYIDVPLQTFNDSEVMSLFNDVLKDKYPKNGNKVILQSAKRLGNLPLALHIFARQLLQSNVSINQIEKIIDRKENIFQDLKYEDKSLHAAIDLSYKKLNSKMKSVLISASIFKGKDFSIDSVGYINGLSHVGAGKVLSNLADLSLIEPSARNRYRIHPEIREFVRKKLDYPRSSYLTSIAIVLFIFFSLWWIYLQIFIDKNNFMYLEFSATYGLMALYGGFCGVHVARKWGGFKTLMGKAIYMFSFGLFAQEFGQIVYSYYAIFLHINNPYPSIGDIGFAGTIPIYTFGAILLAKSSGIKLNIQSFKNKVLAILIPFTALTATYILILKDYVFDFNDPIKTLLDFGNPLGETVCISIAIIIFIFSRNILDGIMRSKALLLLFALVIQFVADVIYIYKSTEFYPGSYMDFLYLFAYFTMTLALLSLKSLQVNIKNT